MRCTRCGHETADSHKFCPECGNFLREAFSDHRLLHARITETAGRHKDARRELEQLVEAEPDHVLANHLLGTMYYHQGTLDSDCANCHSTRKWKP